MVQALFEVAAQQLPHFRSLIHLGAPLNHRCACKPASADSRGSAATSRSSGGGIGSHGKRSGAPSPAKGTALAADRSACGFSGRIIGSSSSNKSTGSVTIRCGGGCSGHLLQQQQAAAAVGGSGSRGSSSSGKGQLPGKQTAWGSWVPQAPVTLQQLELRALAEAEDARHQLQPADAAPWQLHPELQHLEGACHCVFQLSCEEVSTPDFS